MSDTTCIKVLRAFTPKVDREMHTGNWYVICLDPVRTWTSIASSQVMGNKLFHTFMSISPNLESTACMRVFLPTMKSWPPIIANIHEISMSVCTTVTLLSHHPFPQMWHLIGSCCNKIYTRKETNGTQFPSLICSSLSRFLSLPPDPPLSSFPWKYQRWHINWYRGKINRMKLCIK